MIIIILIAATLVSCWSMECVKEHLVETCEANEKPVHRDIRMITIPG